MSSANVTISSTIKTRDNGYKQANAAFHGDERMLNVLLRTLVQQDRFIASQVTMGGVNCGVVSPGQVSATIVLGWKPSYVRTIQYTGTVLTSIAEAYSGMGDSQAIIITGVGSMALAVSGGITFSSTGFKGGTLIFPTGKRINYIAMRRLGT